MPLFTRDHCQLPISAPSFIEKLCRLEEVNLGLSKKADYVIKASIALARAYQGSQYLKLREIAAEMAIPRSYTPQILEALVQAGLAESRAGKLGGYRLAKSPSDISVLELIEAGEGKLRPTTCALSSGPCRWDDVCPMHAIMSSAVARLQETLSAESLADLSSRDLLLERNVLEIPADSHRRPGRMRQYAVEDFIHLEVPLTDVVVSLENGEGEWLGEVLTLATASTLDELHPALPTSGQKTLLDKAKVNLGAIHKLDGSITFPLTIEAKLSKSYLPKLIATVTVTAIDSYRAIAEISGKLEFSPFLIESRLNHSGEAEDHHEQLARLAYYITRKSLRQIASYLETHPS